MLLLGILNIYICDTDFFIMEYSCFKMITNQ